MKKHLRFLLTAVFTFASTIVFGADDVTVGDFTFNLDSKGYAYVKAYNGTAKEIDIPSTVSIDGSNKNVLGIGESAFEGNTTLEKVSILRQYLNYIGDKAFKGCTALKYMNWSESAASNVASATHKANKFFILAVNDIGESAFEGCTSITDINLRWASNLTYGASAFRGCTSLTTASIYAQNINDNAFADCPALNSVYLYSAESVSSSAFALTSGSLRVAYYQLTEELVEALKVNNASVLKAYLTFDESSYVKVISCKVPFTLNNANLTVKYVKSATETDDGGVNLVLEDVPKKELPANTALIVQYTGDKTSPAFSLSLLSSSPTVTYTNVLKAATDYTTLPASTDAARYYLFEYKDRETLDNFVKVTTNTSFSGGTGYLEFGDTSNPYPDFEFGFYTSGNAYVKKYSGSDEVVTIPESIVQDGKSAEVKGFGPGAFEGNTTVKKIILSINGSYTIGERAFKDCTALTTLVYSTESGASASYNETYNGVVLPSSKIAASAFEGCTAITNAKIRYKNTQFLENAMKGCTALSTIGTTNGTVRLESVEYVGTGAFEECTSIRTVIGTTLTEIGDRAFKNSGLYTMLAGTIDGSYFSNRITIVSPVEKVGANAFEGTTAASVYFQEGKIPELGEQAFGGPDAKTMLLPIEYITEELYDQLNASYNTVNARIQFNKDEYVKVISSKMMATLNSSSLVVKRVSAVEETRTGVSVTVEDVPKIIYAGTALIVQYIGTSTGATGINLGVAKDKSKPDYTNYLLPATEATTLPASDGTTNYYKFATTTPGDKTEEADLTTFEKITAETTIPEGSGYLKVVSGAAEAGTTGIRELRTDDKNADVYYNLNGVRVEKPQKGIFIRNGKKIVIK